MLKLRNALIAALALVGSFASAQTVEIGLQAYHDYHGGAIDHINLDNGNLTLTLPLVSYPQRGNALKMNLELVYNGLQRTYTQTCTANPYPGTRPPGPPLCMWSWISSNNAFEQMALTQRAAMILVDSQDLTFRQAPVALPGTNPPQSFMQVSWGTADGGSHSAGQISNGQIAVDGSGFQVGFTESATTNFLTNTCTWDCTLPAIVDNPTLVATNEGITWVRSKNAPFSARGRLDADGNYIVNDGSSAIIDTVGRSISYPVTYTSPSGSQTAGCTGPLPITEIQVWTPPGYSEPYTFCYASATLTLGEIDNTGEPIQYTTHQTVLQSIVLPNLQTWEFEYNESLSNCYDTVNVGDLTHIKLPTGGTIDYTYTCINPSIADSKSHTTAVASRTVNANDGTGPQRWSYQYESNTAGNTTLTDPLNNDTVDTVTSGSLHNQSTSTRVTQEYSGTGSGRALMRTTTLSYPAQYDTASGYPMYPSMQTTTLQITPTASVSTVTSFQYCCDFSFFPASRMVASYGKITDTKIYDYANGPLGTLLRETKDDYWFQTHSNYLNPGYFDLKAVETVFDGSGNQAAKTTYGYDESARVTSGISSLGGGVQMTQPLYGVYGHQTSKSEWLNIGPSDPKSTITYFDTGEPYQETDPRGYITSIYYCTGSSATTVPCSASAYLGALPTAIVNPLNQKNSFIYRTDTGQELSSTDANQQTTTYTYNDPLNRLRQVVYPDVDTVTGTHAETDIQYNDTGQIGVTVTEKIDSIKSKQTQVIVDGVGRTAETILLSDPVSPIYSRTSYDALSRVSQVWNASRCDPMNASSCGTESTWGIATYAYDALGRKTKLTQPDNNAQKWIYSGNVVDYYDETTRHWQRTSDALGRLTKILEPDGSFTIANAPSLESDYTYDALSNLKRVDQLGSTSTSSGERVRTFNYDSLSRLACASNPESATVACSTQVSTSYVAGTLGYAYDRNGNVSGKTDARGVTTSYTYDPLNRLLSKTFLNDATGTASACFQYDIASNGVGRLANEWTQKGSCPPSPSGGVLTQRLILGYDGRGRITNERQCVLSSCSSGSTPYSLTRAYNLVGNISSYSNGIPSGSNVITFTNDYDAAGRLQTISGGQSGASSILFSSQSASSPGCGQTPSYSAFGGLQNAVLGSGLTLSRAYDNRLRQNCESDKGGVLALPTAGSATIAITGSEQSQ